LAVILDEIVKATQVGVSTKSLDELAERLIRDGGDTPAFLDYTPEGAKRPFPATLCVSVNDEVVHGIPTENNKILKNGDIVGLDLGLIHNGMVTDMAVTVGIGEIDENAKKIIEITKKSLSEGIKMCVIGGRIGDIGATISRVVENGGFSVVEELGGHGVGYKVHDGPYIPNFGQSGKGERIMEGMALALEPIVNEGEQDVFLDKDGYTFKTKDGKRSAHFEHTIYIGKNGPEIMTLI
jgi:methionyl aminopeptidase